MKKNFQLIFSLVILFIVATIYPMEKIKEDQEKTPFPLIKLPKDLHEVIGTHLIKKSITETDEQLLKRAKNSGPGNVRLQLVKTPDGFTLFVMDLSTEICVPKMAESPELGESALSFDKRQLAFSVSYLDTKKQKEVIQLFVANLKSKKYASCTVPHQITDCCVSPQGECVFLCDDSATNLYLFNPRTQTYKKIADIKAHAVNKLEFNKQSSKMIALCNCGADKIYELKETRKPVEIKTFAEYAKTLGIWKNFNKITNDYLLSNK